MEDMEKFYGVVANQLHHGDRILTQGFFLQCQKDGIEKLKVLEVIINNIVKFHPLRINK